MSGEGKEGRREEDLKEMREGGGRGEEEKYRNGEK